MKNIFVLCKFFDNFFQKCDKKLIKCALKHGFTAFLYNQLVKFTKKDTP